jgi:hypothetical protein
MCGLAGDFVALGEPAHGVAAAGLGLVAAGTTARTAAAGTGVAIGVSPVAGTAGLDVAPAGFGLLDPVGMGVGVTLGVGVGVAVALGLVLGVLVGLVLGVGEDVVGLLRGAGPVLLPLDGGQVDVR